MCYVMKCKEYKTMVRNRSRVYLQHNSVYTHIRTSKLNQPVLHHHTSNKDPQNAPPFYLFAPRPPRELSFGICPFVHVFSSLFFLYLKFPSC
jgi:hypothetical protein